jgi:hypothetical protein
VKSPDGAPMLVDGYPLRPPPLVIGNWSLVIRFEEFMASFVNNVDHAAIENVME